ncbi:MAG: hydrogenase iron-sulfur subunit [Deltaproteobacteria bacterium]|nr:hydrogenase iron-sulfur subunit [Deltaproteobacteria bacterium]MBT6500689.1 hydrogenase iron-sulfur subunit [Deltaproteobacteria bacterium]MBT6614232.1 hydrogenase iron-sulfur subunit [Deltaproteobacteria bacterium]MBT7151785.1 hydrogenase iron-sulfur subunit [Deltaproteobacteria bacterium]MBT7889836.1 hydrogenase iron-sulfur subunit [Deltaproteobacteria bacterium]
MEGNYYARRKFALLTNLMEHMGVEKDRLHFSWISSAEANKFIDVVNTVTESVKALGPSKNFVKKTG